MIPSGWRFHLFVLISVMTIFMLAVVDRDQNDETNVDRHTGHLIRPKGSYLDLLHSARTSGSAIRSRAILEERPQLVAQEPQLREALATVAAELAMPDAPLYPDHVFYDSILAERARARELRAIVEQDLEKTFELFELLDVLDGLEADASIARATEHLFSSCKEPADPDLLHVTLADQAANYAIEQIETFEIAEPILFHSVADAFRAEGRMRGVLRWTLRAARVFPDDLRTHQRVIDTYLEYGRQHEAYAYAAASLARMPEEITLWRKRLQLAGWLSLAMGQIDALEHIVALEDNERASLRLIALYRYIGKPGMGVPHAARLAEASEAASAMELPAKLAVENGMIDEALAYLRVAADRSDEPYLYREQIVQIALEDLRMQRAIDELKEMHELYPDRGYRDQLCGLYRRTDRRGDLAAVYEEILRENPEDVEAARLLVSLYVGLGNQERVVELLTERVAREQNAVQFFEQMRLYLAIEIPGIYERAQQLARESALSDTELERILTILHDSWNDPELRRTSYTLLRRYPQHAGAFEQRLKLLAYETLDTAQAEEAELLVNDYPKEPRALRTWIERASWTGLVEDEIRGRVMLLGRQPDDSENRMALTELYQNTEQLDKVIAIWLPAAEANGPVSEEADLLVSALFSAGRTSEAMEWLERRAADPASTMEDRLRIADHLFAEERLDRALVFYKAALETEPEHPHALLRAGQIHLWSTDPRGAIPYLEQYLDTEGEEAALAHYVLGEALWETRNPSAARDHHELALNMWLELEERDQSQEMMVARVLVRLDRPEEAIPLLDRLLAANPDDLNLILDYADAMTATDDLERARPLVMKANTLKPMHPRVLRLNGQLLDREGRFEEAAEQYRMALRILHGDAGLEASLGYTLTQAGHLKEAAEAFHRSMELKPDNIDVGQALGGVEDQLAGVVALHSRFQKVSDDRTFVTRLSGSRLLDEERLRLSASAGAGYYKGEYVDENGLEDKGTQTVGLLDVSISKRFDRAHVWGFGINAFPGAPGDVPVGAWLGLHLEGAEPYRSLDIRLYGNELFEAPPAAVDLEGRRHGVLISGFQNLTKRWWVSGEAGADYLTIDAPGAGDTVGDSQFTGGISFGCRLLDGPSRFAEPFTSRRVPHSLVGADPTLVPEEYGPSMDAWLSFFAQGMPGDPDLPAYLPLGDEFLYLTANTRLDQQVLDSWGLMALGSIGTELKESNTFWEVAAGTTWRPDHSTEVNLKGIVGKSFARDDENETSLQLQLGVTLRF